MDDENFSILPPAENWEQLRHQIEEVARRQRHLQKQQAAQAAQLDQITQALKGLGVSLSAFVGLAEDVGGSVRMTKRLWKFAVGIASGLAALFAAFHYGQVSEKPPQPVRTPPSVSEPAPLHDE